MATVLLTGSHGLIGSALIPALLERGDHVVRVVRRHSPGSAGEIVWDPAAGEIDAARLEGADAVVHLAGASIPAARWTSAVKERIRRSRVDGTRLIAQAVAGLARRPRALLCASAVGYYGDRGEEVLTEEHAPGTGFLADVCRAWERAADPARLAGVRVCHLRFAVVLSPAGGALARLVPLFRLGLGGPVGSGRQHLSWVAIEDVVGAVLHVLDHGEIGGPVNVTAPRAATNREFTRALAAALHRPAFAAVPAWAVRALFGEMADEALLVSQRVEPAKLLAAGYAFRRPDLAEALRVAVGSAGRL